jgi:hypothetical protein
VKALLLIEAEAIDLDRRSAEDILVVRVKERGSKDESGDMSHLISPLKLLNTLHLICPDIQKLAITIPLRLSHAIVHNTTLRD